jgi:ATP-dependent Clp protease ATP-binding subunit ClpA
MAAHQAARSVGNEVVSPVHLVLGLLTEPRGIAALAIRSQDVTSKAVGEAAHAALPPAAVEAPDVVPYDAGSRRALILTARTALRLGHNYIGTEHILLGLLEHENGTGLLSDLGLTHDATEQFVLAKLAEITG